MFELRTSSSDSKFEECFKRFVVECVFMKKILVLRLISYAQTARERRQTCFFSQIQPITQTTVIECATYSYSVMCYTILIGIRISSTLGNNILLQSFNWPKPVHYVPIDKINASIRIRIRRILKVNIHIWRMWILTSFFTSLIITASQK